MIIQKTATMGISVCIQSISEYHMKFFLEISVKKSRERRYFQTNNQE
jgi:hypothetical protein